MHYRYTVVAFFFGCLPVLLLVLENLGFTRTGLPMGLSILLCSMIAIFAGLAAAWYESPKAAVFAVLIGLSDLVLLVAA